MPTPAKKVPQKRMTTSIRKGTRPKLALVCAAGEQCFWVKDGKVLASLADLQHALSHMTADVYAHHVTPDRNDFADWVQFELGDVACGKELRKAKNQIEAVHTVAKRLIRR